jgi:hypothetical protein
MRFQDVPQRGKQGKIVASRNRFGQYHKQFVPPKQPATASQRSVWGNMSDLWRVWNELSDERREAWWRQAAEVHSRPSLGQSGSLDGPLLFRKINTVLQTCRRELLLDPPPLPAFGPNPVVGFTIREGKGGIALRLKVSPALRWEDRPALEDLMVFAWAPCNPGVSRQSTGLRRCRLSRLAGLSSAPAQSNCELPAYFGRLSASSEFTRSFSASTQS